MLQNVIGYEYKRMFLNACSNAVMYISVCTLTGCVRVYARMCLCRVHAVCAYICMCLCTSCVRMCALEPVYVCSICQSVHLCVSGLVFVCSSSVHVFVSCVHRPCV